IAELASATGISGGVAESKKVEHEDDDGTAEEIEPEPDSDPGDDMRRDTPVIPVLAQRREPATQETPKTASLPSDRPSEDRLLEHPPEVDPADLEIHQSPLHLLAAGAGQAKPSAQAKPPPVRLPLPVPLYARGAELAAAMQAQQAAESQPGKRARYWWDE